MHALVVLAAVAALLGALGAFLTERRKSDRPSRHRGGAAATPRAAAATVALATAAAVLLLVLDRTEVGLAALALWWLSLPWLAVTSRLGAWAHAGWTHAVNAAAIGLVDLAWRTTTHQHSPVAALGVWTMWLLAAAAAFVVLASLLGLVSVGEGRATARLRPATVSVLALGGATAAAVSLVFQQGPAPASLEAGAARTPEAGSTSVAAPPAPTTTPAEPTSTEARRTHATVVARSQRRSPAPTTSTRAPAPVPTTTPAPPTRTAPTTTLPTTAPATSTTSPTATTTTLDIRIWPPNNPHHTPPGHR